MSSNPFFKNNGPFKLSKLINTAPEDVLIFDIKDLKDATDKDIIEAGGEDYIKTRQEKENRLKEGESLNGKEIPLSLIHI